MKSCDYCGQPATTEIPAIPGRVCLAHAHEFWTGLLAFVHNRQSDPTADRETPSVSEMGHDEGMGKLRLVTATAATRAPQITTRVPLRKAS